LNASVPSLSMLIQVNCCSIQVNATKIDFINLEQACQSA